LGALCPRELTEHLHPGVRWPLETTIREGPDGVAPERGLEVLLDQRAVVHAALLLRDLGEMAVEQRRDGEAREALLPPFGVRVGAIAQRPARGARPSSPGRA
jgi:hypothetical protein